MKKTAAALIVLLLITAAAGVYFTQLSKANPYMYHETISPPSGSIPLEISVMSPKNNTLRGRDVTLSFNITTEDTSIHYLLGAYYKANWMADNVTVYKQDMYSPEFPTFWDYSHTFRQMPDGEYSVTITAWGDGGYGEGLTYYFFDMTTISVINFTVGTTTPTPESTLTTSPSPEPIEVEPFPTTLAMASASIVAVVGLALLVYLKKRHRL